VSVPHNLEAEESLLGSMLLSPEAIRVALDLLDAADFYKPIHQLVFGAIAALHAREKPVDPVIVAAELAPRVNLGDLLAIQAGTPASVNAPRYAEIVARDAARRRALGFAADLRETASAGDPDELIELLRAAESRLMPPSAHVQPGVDVGDLVAQGEIDPPEWAIRDVLSVGEAVIITGGEGHGKTTLLRQLAMQVAFGRHPWQRTNETPRRVLYIDLQDPVRHVRSQFARFLDGPARGYERGSGWLSIVARPNGMDLCSPQDARWLDALVATHNPALVCLGPIYRAYRGQDGANKASEETADVVTDVFARLMVRRSCALILEAHTVHDGEKADYRPRGSRLWEGWPAFGFGLMPPKSRSGPEEEEGKRSARYRLVRWRGQRDRDRPWPEHLLALGFSRGGWPWVPPASDASTVDTTTGTQDEVF
jgi:replicative DNA helicase